MDAIESLEIGFVSEGRVGEDGLYYSEVGTGPRASGVEVN